MDPYVKVIIDNNQKRTKTAKNQGKKPAWSDKMNFSLKGSEQ